MSLKITMGQALVRVLGTYPVPDFTELIVLLNKRTWFSGMTVSLTQNCKGNLAPSWEPVHPVIQKEGLRWRMVWGFFRKESEFSNSFPSFFKGEPQSPRWRMELSTSSQKELEQETPVWVPGAALFPRALHTMAWLYLFIYLCFLLTSLRK